ncbi:pitrilysin family protein [Pseudomonas sp. FP2196]|uniref:M16 family metallopeptidase n=1 Tax=Pseudomonas sp. FP2196 TaxID=2954086 RepID=UPI0027365A88|nr:pitrilysin family protein [Pseudomonas sp. FP2196]WLH35363.1 pitrilysin family protein [Pseudomonas sp. FP2196]
MLLILCLAPLISLAAPAPPTHQFTLDNGLNVLVREDHRAPLVTSQLWFKVGSADEAPGQSGLSHALEHMLYKGSSKTCAGEASAILQTLGARENAFTSKDATTYYQILAPRYLGVAFELMADLMSTAHLRTSDLTPEMAVIREERRLRTDDAPHDLALERLTGVAHLANSYRTPILGWMHDLHRLNADDLRHWYATRYAPGNATLVVVGAVTLDQVERLAQRHFGPLPARPVPRLLRPTELAQPGERKLTLSLAVPTPQLIMAFNVPGLATAENRRSVHALRLIDALLGGTHSARLKKRLEFTEQLFSDVSTFYDALTRGDSLLLMTAELASAHADDLDAAEARVWQMIEELHAHPPTAEELERARTQLIARQIYTQDSIVEQARELATLASIDLPWQLMDKDSDELAQVTPADIQQAASTFLTRERLTVAHVLAEAAHE